MRNFREVLQQADQNHVAVGHFNISDLIALKAVAEAARELSVPVVVGLSEGERAFMGARQAAALVRSLREDEGLPIYLNADHTHTLAGAVEVARAGYDAIVFDRSSLPFDLNIAETRQAIEAVKSLHPEILVEGEIGDIGSGSEIHDKAPETASTLTDPEEARQFVAATGVDILAPAVGTMHGLLRSMVRGDEQKRLNIQRIREVKQATGIFMTLHGGSGTNDEDFRKAIQAGITMIHINTEVRLAWRRGMEESLAQHPDEIAPYKILPQVVETVEAVVRSRLRLFNDRVDRSEGGQTGKTQSSEP